MEQRSDSRLESTPQGRALSAAGCKEVVVVRNEVKHTLRDGGIAIGTMVYEFNSTGIGRIVSAAGADFVVFDMEHSGWTTETIRSLIATSRSAPIVLT